MVRDSKGVLNYYLQRKGSPAAKNAAGYAVLCPSPMHTKWGWAHWQRGLCVQGVQNECKAL